jgi:NADH-quinone oxidoreductase subunit G
MNGDTSAQLGLRAGDAVLVRQGQGEATLPVALDERVPARCVRIPAGHPDTAALGPMYGPVEVRAAAREVRKAG